MPGIVRGIKDYIPEELNLDAYHGDYMELKLAMVSLANMAYANCRCEIFPDTDDGRKEYAEWLKRTIDYLIDDLISRRNKAKK